MPASSCVPPSPSSHSKSPLQHWRFSLGKSLLGVRSLAVGSVFGENEVECHVTQQHAALLVVLIAETEDKPQSYCLLSEMIQ